MKLLVEDYQGDQVTYTNVNSFDFDGETGELFIWYNDEPLSMYVVASYIKRIKYVEG